MLEKEYVLGKDCPVLSDFGRNILDLLEKMAFYTILIKSANS